MRVLTLGNPSDEFRKKSEDLFNEITAKYVTDKGYVAFSICENIAEFNRLVEFMSKGVVKDREELFMPMPWGVVVIPYGHPPYYVAYTCESISPETERIEDIFLEAADELPHLLRLPRKTQMPVV